MLIADFKKPVGNGRRANCDSYQNADRRYGLVRRLSISSELQWFAGESQNATGLKLGLNVVFNFYSWNSLTGKFVLIWYVLIKWLCESLHSNVIRKRNLWIQIQRADRCRYLFAAVNFSRTSNLFRSLFEMSCLKPLWQPLNVSVCLATLLLGEIFLKYMFYCVLKCTFTSASIITMNYCVLLV